MGVFWSSMGWPLMELVRMRARAVGKSVTAHVQPIGTSVVAVAVRGIRMVRLGRVIRTTLPTRTSVKLARLLLLIHVLVSEEISLTKNHSD